jgi:uncharacterized damage-inducible protein DinB
MVQHLHWANQRILERLQTINEDNEQVRKLFSHILFAEQVWLTRLKGLDSTHLLIWGDVSILTCAEMVEQNNGTLTELLTGLNENDLENVITYKNSKGTEFQNTVREILTHIALHGQYHRGQINQQIRTAGIEPISTDYITFVRSMDIIY